ncbi:MAPEG family protein [Devosia pacifica]|uniref:MAPEG family protein n=1 Tax=Devosia pacifica TaxID=1335967 RepID=UPI0016796001|nr:MAPEG family protein [Devosia pacifica]
MTLVEKFLLVAMALQAALTFFVLVRMGQERVPRVMRGEIPMRDIAVDREAYPLKARLLSNNFDNQFQLPVLFYVVVILAITAGGANWAEVALAYFFVALRYFHTAIHTGTNNVMQRFQVYVAGFGVLALLWLVVLLRLLLSGAA